MSEQSSRHRRLGVCAALTRSAGTTRDAGTVINLPANCSRLTFAAIAAADAAAVAAGSSAATDWAGTATAPVPLAPVPSSHHGDFSATIIRHPFARAVSASMYKVCAGEPPRRRLSALNTLKGLLKRLEPSHIASLVQTTSNTSHTHHHIAIARATTRTTTCLISGRGSGCTLQLSPRATAVSASSTMSKRRSTPTLSPNCALPPHSTARTVLQPWALPRP